MLAQRARQSRTSNATGRRPALRAAALRAALPLAALALALTGPARAQAPPDAPVVVANLGGGFIEFLFGGSRAADPPPQPHAQPHRAAPPPVVPAPAPAPEAAPAPAAGWGLSYCVRSCDGYAFPLGTMHGRGDAAAHGRACAAACPGAATELYVGSRQGGFAQARAIAGGAPYAAHAQAFRHRRERVEGCSCALAQTPAAPWAAGDATLRRGDVLVTATGALVFDGARFVDFRDDRATSRALRGRIDALLGISAREARLAAWRRANPGRIEPHVPDVFATGTTPDSPVPPARPATLGAEGLAAFSGWGLRVDASAR